MRRRLGFATLLAAAALAATASARTAAPSGDTCTFSASGTTYTVRIITGSGIQQYGFAFGAPGLTVTSVAIPGQNGGFTGGQLPPNTTGAWISDTPMTGSFVATLTATGTATGPMVIVPSAASQSSYLDPVTCKTSAPAAGGAAAGNVAFTVASRAEFSTAARGWRLVVTVPAAATVSAKQPLATSISKKPKPLVQAKRVAINSRGKVTLTLKATPAGQAALATNKSLKVKITVTVDTRDGREEHKTVSLTLRK